MIDGCQSNPSTSLLLARARNVSGNMTLVIRPLEPGTDSGNGSLYAGAMLFDP